MPGQVQRRQQTLAPNIGGDTHKVAQNLRFLMRNHQEPNVAFLDLARREGQEVLEAIIQETDPKLVIFDNFSSLFFVRDENDASAFGDVERLLNRLKAQGRSVLIVHHARKDGGSYRGSSRLADIPSVVVRLHKLTDDASGSAGFRWEFEKTRDRLNSPRSFVARLTDDGWVTSGASPRDGLLHQVVCEVRSGQHGLQKELAEALGLTEPKVSRLKTRAIQGGLIGPDEWQECLSGGVEKAANDDNEDF